MPRSRDGLPFPTTWEELDHYVAHIARKKGRLPLPVAQEYIPNAARAIEAYDGLRELLSREDGWLRVVPDYDRRQMFFKWKFTSGAYPNHYCMWVCSLGDIREGILGLLQRVKEVEAGERRPVKDRPYDR